MASHIGKLPVAIPAGVEVKIDGQSFSAKGAKGSDSYEIPEGITANVEGNEIVLVPVDDLRPTRAKHGLARSIVASMVKGVHEGYAKTLEIVGTGYRAQMKGKGIEFSLGYSHTITVEPPAGIEFELPNPNQVIVKGIDKQAVGQCAPALAQLAGGLLLGQIAAGHQLTDAGRLFHRVEVFALQVLHQRKLHGLLICHVLDDDRHLGEARHPAGPPAALACHDEVAAGRLRAHRDGLQ